MQTISLSMARNLVIAATLAIATFATWAITDYQAPIIESAGTQSPQA